MPAMKTPIVYVIRPKTRWELVEIRGETEKVQGVWGSEQQAMDQFKQDLRDDAEDD